MSLYSVLYYSINLFLNSLVYSSSDKFEKFSFLSRTSRNFAAVFNISSRIISMLFGDLSGLLTISVLTILVTTPVGQTIFILPSTLD
jgi:hypothetical protein